MSNINKRATLARHAPVAASRGPRSSKQLDNRAERVMAGNRDMLRQDRPETLDATDSMGQMFWQNAAGQAFWQDKIGFKESVQRYAGYRSNPGGSNYGYANRKYLYLLEVIPFYERRFRKPPENPRPLY